MAWSCRISERSWSDFWHGHSSLSVERSTREALQANVVRIPAWVTLGLAMLLVGCSDLTLHEPAISIRAAGHAHSVVEGLLVTFFVYRRTRSTEGRSGIRYWQARELAGSPLWYRLLVVPGNVDIAAAALLVAAGDAAGS